MENIITKASIRFWEDLLYFQHFMQIFVSAPIDLFHIVCVHAYIGHVARYFSIIGRLYRDGANGF